MIVRIEDVLEHQFNLLSNLKVAREVIGRKGDPDFLISGPVDTGQFEFATKLALLSGRELVELNYYALEYQSTNLLYKSILKFWTSNEDKVIHIHRLDEMLSRTEAPNLLNIIHDFLTTKISTGRGPVLVISGEREAIERIHAINPALYSLFYRADTHSMSPSEISLLTASIIKANGRVVDEGFSENVSKLLSRSSGNGNLRNAAIAKSLALDLLKKVKEGEPVSSEMVNLKQIRLILASETKAFEELNSLVGLDDIKKTVSLWASNVGIYERRKELGLVAPGAGQHMVFKGPAGTAKTTVARIVAKVLAETSVLASGHLIEIDRGDIVADSAEQTAKNVTLSVRQALGGVLFIDEAYSITNNNLANGKVAIDTLLKLMEDYRDEFIVIVAGYPNEMEGFLSSNPGLRSRFVKVLSFPSYSVDELLAILHHMANSRGFIIEDRVDEALRARINLQSQYPGFGNGRYIRNLLDGAIELQGSRVDVNSSDEEIRTLRLEDFAENSKYKIKA